MHLIPVVSGLVALAAVVAAVALSRRGAAPPAAAMGMAGAGGKVDLRQAVLSREVLAGRPPGASGQMLCALMDWGVGNGVATLAAFDDGTVSLYTSAGGGVIGAGSRAAVRAAAEAFRSEVEKVRARFVPATAYALPGTGSAIFWAVAADQTWTSGPVPVGQIQQSPFWLAASWQAAQATIGRMRETTSTR